jgi:acetyl-CoA C-acetyltransferase
MLAQPIYVVDGARTPFLKSKNRPGPFAAADLATQAGRSLLSRQKFSPDELDEVILGCAAPSVDEVNIGRVAALRMGCGQKVPGWTVMRNCASGMQALDSGINNILAGRSSLVLAGGVDALSRAPLLYGDKMVLWFSDMAAARTATQRISLFGRLPVKALLAPVIGIMKGLTDPMVGLLMGQTAENLAHRFGITREQMDLFSVKSHEKVIRAQDQGTLASGGGEVEALYDAKGNTYTLDDGVRRDASPQNLAKLKPFFDRKYGSVTPGNSSQITDGAAWLVLASEEIVRKNDLTPLGRILDSEPRPERPRLLGDQRGLRRAGARLPRRLEGREVLQGRTGPGETARRIESGEAKRGRRGDRPRPPGRRFRCSNRFAFVEDIEAQQRETRHGVDLHRRRPRRGNVGRSAVRGEHGAR